MVAVDFGHAVWIEYNEVPFGEDEHQSYRDRSYKDRYEYRDLELELEQSETENGVENEEDTDTAGQTESEIEVEVEVDVEVEVEADPPKRLRFVTFPPFSEDYEAEFESSSLGHGRNGSVAYNCYEGDVRTLEIPSELDLSTVETINIDQSQGAVILSDKRGRIFILCYE